MVIENIEKRRGILCGSIDVSLSEDNRINIYSQEKIEFASVIIKDLNNNTIYSINNFFIHKDVYNWFKPINSSYYTSGFTLEIFNKGDESLYYTVFEQSNII